MRSSPKSARPAARPSIAPSMSRARPPSTSARKASRASWDPSSVLVNSAGVLQNVADIATFSLEEHDKVWAINYRGTYLCCRAFAPRMAARRSGSIVNISSTSAAGAMPLLAYGPGKAAIQNLTAILAVELGPDNVRVNAVMPGYVLTEQMQSRIDAGKRDPRSMKNHSALGRMVSPDDVANGIHFLCSDAASCITGIALPIDAGYLAAVTYVHHPGLAGVHPRRDDKVPVPDERAPSRRAGPVPRSARRP